MEQKVRGSKHYSDKNFIMIFHLNEEMNQKVNNKKKTRTLVIPGSLADKGRVNSVELGPRSNRYFGQYQF